MSDLAKDAKETAAKATGLRPDQVERAVEEYRKAAAALHDEPEWVAILHMSLREGGGLHQYIAAAGETKVMLQVECDKREQVNVYVFDGKPFETYSEARAAELLATVRPTPYEVSP